MLGISTPCSRETSASCKVFGDIMGRFVDGNYYRDENDAESQWLEDGANLVGATFIGGICALFIGVIQICIGFFYLIFPDDR